MTGGGLKAKDIGEFVLVSVAAEMLGVSKQRVHQLKNGGILGHTRIGGTVLIKSGDIEVRIDKMLKEGRS